MRIAPLAALAAVTTLTAAPAFAADPVEGEWITADGTGKVRIAPCPGKTDHLCGRITGAVNPTDANALDSKNPNPQLRTRPLTWLVMMSDFKSVGTGRWTGGRLYDPTAGKTYDGKLSINANGTLKVEGCISVICLAQTWRRVS